MIAYIKYSVSDTAWNSGELACFIFVATYDVLSPRLEMINQGTERNYLVESRNFFGAQADGL